MYAGALHARVRVAAPRRRSGMARQADSAACRLVSTEATDGRASRRTRRAPPGQALAVSARHTHPSASSRAETTRRSALARVQQAPAPPSAGAGAPTNAIARLRLFGRDSERVGSLVAALLAEQKTAEPGDELLRFGA